MGNIKESILRHLEEDAPELTQELKDEIARSVEHQYRRAVSIHAGSAKLDPPDQARIDSFRFGDAVREMVAHWVRGREGLLVSLAPDDPNQLVFKDTRNGKKVAFTVPLNDDGADTELLKEKVKKVVAHLRPGEAPKS